MVGEALYDLVALARILPKARDLFYPKSQKEFYEYLKEIFSPVPQNVRATYFDRAQEIWKKMRKKKKNLKKKLGHLRRLLQLRELFTAFSAASDAFCESYTSAQPRIQFRFLICLNSADLLFGRDRRAKNMEIRDILEFLSSPEAGGMPFDLVVIGAERDLGPPWVGADAVPQEGASGIVGADPTEVSLRHDLLLERDIKVDERSRIERRAIASGIVGVAGAAATKRNAASLPDSERSGPRAKGGREADDHGRQSPITNEANWIHFAKAMKPTRFLVDNFLPLAASLFICRVKDAEENAVRRDKSVSMAGIIGGMCEETRQLLSDKRNIWSRKEVPDLREDIGKKTRNIISLARC